MKSTATKDSKKSPHARGETNAPSGIEPAQGMAEMAERKPLSLYVPEPHCRPGDTPDFSDMEIPAAGTDRRPPVDVDPQEIKDLAYSIIRVLNREGQAVGPWAGTLTDAELLDGLRHMMTLRAFDQRMLMAQRQGKTSF
jgi:2-oxoisovalerate dehydrogenase E1 component alpha subunit